MFIIESLEMIEKCKNENEKLFVHIIEPAFISKYFINVSLKIFSIV